MNWTTVYQVKYLALTLFQILNTMSEHILLNKLLICSRVFNFFVLLFICYYYFISYLTFLTLNILINFYYKSFYPLVNFYSFLVFLTYCKAHLIMLHWNLLYISLINCICNCTRTNFLVNKHPRREGRWSKTFLFFFRYKIKKAFEQRVFYLASSYLVFHSSYKSIGMSLYAVTNVRKPSAANI